MMPEVLGHMKDIALENFVHHYKLDADASTEHHALNEYVPSCSRLSTLRPHPQPCSQVP
jgi:hypothetical protein